MENAVDALKIAFAVMVFTIALSVAMATFSQARETSETVLYMNDKTNYYMYDQIGEEQIENPGTDIEYTRYDVIKSDGTPGITYTDKRIVGIEAIIPTLYRYYKENYTVIFEGIDIYHIDSTTKKWIKDTGAGDEINYFDLNSEIKANCPWVGTVNDIKKNLDLFLKGTTSTMPLTEKSFGNTERPVEYVGFISKYANTKFLEQLGEYSTDRNYGIETDVDGQKCLVIGSEKWKYDSKEGKIDSDDNGDFDTKLSVFLKSKDLDINNNATTYFDDNETNGEIIELAKPTIKRVIKYTKLP